MAKWLRTVLPALALVAVLSAHAQRLDSIHVFKRLPQGHYTSASANALAWQLLRGRAPFTTVTGDRMATAREAMTGYLPARHTFRNLPTLTHVAIAWSGGRPVALGVADDLDLIINFTARTEYRISGMTDRIKVRALLARMVVE
ncbi:MAG: hypothetical protein KDB93_08125 [Flavobacteriales bacterium]|nr:hypothetical protein [Flavobacteriales bacterium]